MGYYTRYKLEIQGVEDAEKTTLIAKLRSVSEGAEMCINENGAAEERGTWYEHEADIRGFSKDFPAALFILSGEGEEPGNLWRKYFKNGKCQEAQVVITYPEFDEKLLI